MKPYEFLTLVGIVVGPIAAVLITLWIDGRRATRERRLAIFRALLATYKLVSDANWSIAMNLLLVEFSKHKAIVASRRDYMTAARRLPSQDEQDAYAKEMLVRQTALVYQVARALGFPITEGELQTEAYAANGMIIRDNLLLDSQRAMRDIATALERQLEFVQSRASSRETL